MQIETKRKKTNRLQVKNCKKRDKECYYYIDNGLIPQKTVATVSTYATIRISKCIEQILII